MMQRTLQLPVSRLFELFSPSLREKKGKSTKLMFVEPIYKALEGGDIHECFGWDILTWEGWIAVEVVEGDLWLETGG